MVQLILSNKDGVFFTILALSVTGFALIIQGFMRCTANVLMPEETTNQIREMISQRKFKELIEFTETDPSFISKALNPALKRAPSFSSMKEAMETAIGEQTLVTLIHSGWETFDDPAAARAEYDQGWPMVLTRYAEQVQDPEALTGDQGRD